MHAQTKLHKSNHVKHCPFIYFCNLFHLINFTWQVSLLFRRTGCSKLIKGKIV
jgi:hypothetical protein